MRDLIERFREASGVQEAGIALRPDGWAIVFGTDALRRSWTGLAYEEVERLLTEAVEAAADGYGGPQ